jgi:hypothetical protein
MIFQLKISLVRSHSPIWRRVLVSGQTSLQDLHTIIQAVFGWWDYHLHAFTVHGVEYSNPNLDPNSELNFQDESIVTLESLALGKKSKFMYQYDFGDSWDHQPLVEDIIQPENSMKLPLCIAGKRARPPEYVGGMGGYEQFLEAVRDPEHEQHDEYLTWAGGAFDPDAFDLKAANEKIILAFRREWIGHSPTEDALPAKLLHLDPHQLDRLLSFNKAAEYLSLRKDVAALLSYIREHKVTGTQATGNFPRKAIEEIAEKFCAPPELETRIGDSLYRFKNETEVWSVFFMHILAQGAGLINGGPGRRWRATQEGEAFSDLPAAVQVRILLITWWYRIDWTLAYPAYETKFLPDNFNQSILMSLKALWVEQSIPFEDFAEQAAAFARWGWRGGDPSSDRMTIHAGMEQMLIDPLEAFGIVITERINRLGGLSDIHELVSFRLTKFCKEFLESI